MDWICRIRAFYPPNQGGGLAGETVHATAASRDVEIAAYRTRMQRGEISHIEVIALTPPYKTETLWQ